jgi:hypothetical protein
MFEMLQNGFFLFSSNNGARQDDYEKSKARLVRKIVRLVVVFCGKNE